MSGNITLKQGSSFACVTSGGSVSTATVVAANGAANLTNSSGLQNIVSARLVAGFGSNPTEGNIISLYLVPVLDGTHTAGFDTSGTPPLGYLAGNFYIALAQTAVQYMDIDQITLSAYDYTPYIFNQSGQTMSSSWTLTFYGSISQYT